MNLPPIAGNPATLLPETRDPTPAEQLETLRLKLLAFRTHVFGSTPLPPVIPNKFAKILVLRILRMERPLTKEIIDKLPAAGRIYAGTALGMLELKLRHITPNNKGVQSLLASPRVAELDPQRLDPTLASLLAGIIEQSFAPSLDAGKGRARSPAPANHTGPAERRAPHRPAAGDDTLFDPPATEREASMAGHETHPG